MTRREKIIVGAMVLAVIYAVYILFFAAPRKPKPFAKPGGNGQQLESLNAFITKVAEKSKTRLSKKEAYILKKAQEKWAQDPLAKLRDGKLAQQKNAKAQVLKGKLQYSGFLQMGTRRLAIINGMEYENGDKLEPGGYVIGSIHPNQVVLITLDGSRRKFILPLEEMQ